MSDCPCCNGKLLQHIGSSRIYWFCPDCRQEMPNMSSVIHGNCLSSARLSTKKGKPSDACSQNTDLIKH